jgi:hypothetical protein
MSKYVNDVRSTSSDPRYMGAVFTGTMREAIAQAKSAKSHPLPTLKGKPRGMSRGRFALLQFLNLTKPVAVGYDVGREPKRSQSETPEGFYTVEYARKQGWI